MWARHGSHTESLSVCYISGSFLFFGSKKNIKKRSVSVTPENYSHAVSAGQCREGCYGFSLTSQIITMRFAAKHEKHAGSDLLLEGVLNRKATFVNTNTRDKVIMTFD